MSDRERIAPALSVPDTQRLPCAHAASIGEKAKLPVVAGRRLCCLRRHPVYATSLLPARQQLAYVYYENEPGRRSAVKLLTKDEARRIAAMLSLPPPIRAIAAPPTVPV